MTIMIDKGQVVDHLTQSAKNARFTKYVGVLAYMKPGYSSIIRTLAILAYASARAMGIPAGIQMAAASTSCVR